MSLENEPRVERTIVEQPAVIRREEIRGRESGGATGWWIATIVAVVAVMGLIFLYTNSRPGEADLQAAQDAGRSQAMMETATTQAQTAAQAATEASANAASSMAGATQAAADSARAAADRTAEATRDAAASAQDAAQDATSAPPQQ